MLTSSKQQSRCADLSQEVNLVKFQRIILPPARVEIVVVRHSFLDEDMFLL